MKIIHVEPATHAQIQRGVSARGQVHKIGYANYELAALASSFLTLVANKKLAL